MKRLAFARLVIFILLAILFPIYPALSASCEQAVNELNSRIAPRVDEHELVEILRSLNVTNNRDLPSKFVTKQQARSRGWRPGKDLWSAPALTGASMGGDRFMNREGRLPQKKWREADLDYKGGHRGGKRLIFSRDGTRFVTVDHYRTFIEVPACR